MWRRGLLVAVFLLGAAIGVNGQADAAKKLTWKPLEFAILKFNDEAPNSWNIYHSERKGLLLVRLDKENWMKCGVEFVDGEQNMSVVITRDFSDWSTFRLPEGTGPVWMRVVRKKEALDIFYSLDAKNFAEIRTGYLVPSESVDVGPAFAAPEGKGFEVRFDDWVVEKNEAK